MSLAGWGAAVVDGGGGWSTGPSTTGSTSGGWSTGTIPSGVSGWTFASSPAPAPAPSYYYQSYSLLAPSTQQAPARSYDVADPYGEGGLYVEFDSPLLHFLKGGQSPELTARQQAQRSLIDLLLLGGIVAVLLK